MMQHTAGQASATLVWKGQIVNVPVAISQLHYHSRKAATDDK